MLTVSLITLGSPDQLTGGYLYHRRMADLAPAHDARVDFVSVPAGPFLPAVAAGRQVARAAKGTEITVVDSIAAAFLAPWRLPRPAVAILHQPPGGIDAGRARRAGQRWLDRTVYRRCELLILASQTLVNAVPGCACVVVPPGSDPGLSPLPACGPLPNLRQGRRVAMLTVGNWLPRKGILDLLVAFGRIPGDTATLHLVGRTDQDPAYTDRVRTRLAAPELRGRVVVHGPVPPREMGVLYAGSDVFVLASYEEAYGTVYGEALAAGLPVVGWRVGNLPNLAVDGREGIVLEPGDLAGLASALERVALDDEYRERLSGAAGIRGRELPTWRETASLFFDTLREEVERGRR
jgi:glycosyltransferase involved in cell wall biosynthesis